MKNWISNRFNTKSTSTKVSLEQSDISGPADKITDLDLQILRIHSEFKKTVPLSYPLPFSPTYSAITPSHLLLSNEETLLIVDLKSYAITKKSYDMTINFLSYISSEDCVLISGSAILKVSLSSFEVIHKSDRSISFIRQQDFQLIGISSDTIQAISQDLSQKDLYEHPESFLADTNGNYIFSLSRNLLLVYQNDVVFIYDKFDRDALYMACNSNYVAVCGKFNIVLLIKLGTWEEKVLYIKNTNVYIHHVQFKTNSDLLIAACDGMVWVKDIKTDNDIWILANSVHNFSIAGFLNDEKAFCILKSKLKIFPSFKPNESEDRYKIKFANEIKGIRRFNGLIIAFSSYNVYTVDDCMKAVSQIFLENEILSAHGGTESLVIGQSKEISIYDMDFKLNKKFSVNFDALELGEINDWILVLTEGGVKFLGYDSLTIKEFSYHRSRPKCWTSLDDSLMVGDSDGRIKIWDIKTETVVETLKSENSIDSIAVVKNYKYLLSIEIHGIVVWNLRTYTQIYRIFSLSNSKLLDYLDGFCVTLNSKKEIMILDMNDFSSFTSVVSSSELRDIMIFDNKIVGLKKRSVILFTSPLLCKDIQVFGLDNRLVSRYKKRIIKDLDRTSKKYEKFHNVVISPYNISYLTISVYLNNKENIKELIDINTLRPTCSDQTVISVCTNKNFLELARIIFKLLKIKLVKNPYCLFYFENSLIQLNRQSAPSLHKFYQIALGKSLTKNLPRFCKNTNYLPKIIELDTISTQPELFKIEYSSRGNAVDFFHSFIKLNTVLGSKESIEFLDSILHCENSLIFKTEIIRIIINEKWKKVKVIIMWQGVVYASYLILLSIFVSEYSNKWFLISLFVSSQLLLLYEAYQLVSSPLNYVSDMWNIVDISRALLFIAYSVDFWENGSSRAELLAVVVFLSWTRGLTYFRLFYSTRYYIHLLFEVIKDMFSFFIIFFYSVIGFCIVFYALFSEEEANNLFNTTYMVNFALVNTDGFSKLDWLFLLLVSMLNPIIMLNLLISIMNDTFGRVKAEFEIVNMSELCYLIKEVELLMYWRRDLNKKTYLHVCSAENKNKRQEGEIKYYKGINRTIKEINKKLKERDNLMRTYAGNIKLNFPSISQHVNFIKSKLGIRF